MSGKAKELVDKAIESNKVVVFSKTYCSYCKTAKTALKDAGLVNFLVIELEDRVDCDAIQDYLRSITGMRSVPQVFVDHKFLSDGSKTKELQRKGELVPILKKCGAL